VILYDLTWTEAQRLRAVIVDRLTPDEQAAPSTLGSLHERINARVRGHG
jgi:hypothetical protein